MSIDPLSAPPVQPGPPRPSWFRRLPRAAVAGGIAVGVALGTAGIAFAATSSSSSTTTPSSTPSKPNSPAPHKRGHFFGPRSGVGPGVGLGRVIHGQFTVPSGSGYKTVEVQVGTASAVSSSSITVTSADHYQHTYAVTSSTIVDAQRDGIHSVANGDQVRVLATTVNGHDTAISITDPTKQGASRKQFGVGPGSVRPAAFAGWGTATD